MDYCIYHSRDLDGITSGAVIHAHQKQFGEEVALVGFDYGQKLDTRRFKGKVTVMVDVSMPMDRMETLGLGCLEFIWIDHHVSAFNDLIQYCNEKEYEVKEREINGLITMYEVNGMNMTYYYSERLSGCEITATLFAQKLGPNARTLISMLGQYDTWRKEDEKKFVKDKNWEDEVLPAQWATRTLETPIDIYKELIAIDDWSTNVTLDSILNLGRSILKYQRLQYQKIMETSSFEFEFNDWKVLAVNAHGFSSVAFEGYYFEEVHDLMMSFSFNGKTNLWTISMYTTKEDIDILTVAKDFGGGGHKQACGFSVAYDELRFEKGRLEIGRMFIFDVTAIPDFDPKDKKQIQAILNQMTKTPLTFEKTEKNVLENINPNDIEVIEEEVVNSINEHTMLKKVEDDIDEIVPSRDEFDNLIADIMDSDDDDIPFTDFNEELPKQDKVDEELERLRATLDPTGYKYSSGFLQLKDARESGRLIRLPNKKYTVIEPTKKEIEILKKYGKV